jgi:hypothetical protein
MMENARRNANEHGSFRVTRHDRSIELVCDRCLQPKVTKLEIVWTTAAGARKTICNGCYGRLRSGLPL